MGFNASSTAAVMTGTLHLKDAAGNELWYVPPMPEGTDAETAAKWAEEKKQPVTVTVFGPGSRENSQAAAHRQNKGVERFRKRKGRVSGDEMTNEEADFLTAVTIRFENMDYPDNQPMTTDKKQIHAFYADRTIGFYGDQVSEYLGDWENFTKSSATS
jgi:hypothetical protein